MPTIGETLNDIEILQEEISRFIETHGSDEFLSDIMSFTTAYWFELAGHACLDVSAGLVSPPDIWKKYYTLRRRREFLEEYIRWNNIGGLFIIWNVYERHIRRIQKSLLKSDGGPINVIYKEILKKRGFGGRQLRDMLSEFEAIRLTRNSFHTGGIYRNPKRRVYYLRNEKYVLEQGKPVKPIRLISVLQILWNHYKQLA